MSDRNLPATPRRAALARKAGLVVHAPSLTTAAAWAGALVAALALAPSVAEATRAALRRGLEVAGEANPSSNAGSIGAPQLGRLVGLVAESAGAALLSALPVALAAAALALLVHVAQVRALWIPRRAIAGAPAPPSGLGARAKSALWATVRGGALAAAALGWLVAATPRVAQTLQVGAAQLLAAGASLVAGAALVIVATWVALGALELIGRALALMAASRMTAEEMREELRAAGGGGRRWAAQRQRAMSGASPPLAERQRQELAEAALLVVGDEVCAAIAWHATKAPSPRVVAVRRGAGATSLLAEARRQRLPIHRDPPLAERLVRAGVLEAPRETWPELARIFASRAGRASAGRASS